MRSENGELLAEGIATLTATAIVYKRLAGKWADWPAYRVGIIDENGDIVGSTDSKDAKSAWTSLDRLLWRARRLGERAVGRSLFRALIIKTIAFSSLKEAASKELEKDLRDLVASLKDEGSSEEVEMTLFDKKGKEIERLMKKHGASVDDVFDALRKIL